MGPFFYRGVRRGTKRPSQTSDHLIILNKSDCELHEIMIKSRGHSVHTGHGIEPTVKMKREQRKKKRGQGWKNAREQGAEGKM